MWHAINVCDVEHDLFLRLAMARSFALDTWYRTMDNKSESAGNVAPVHSTDWISVNPWNGWEVNPEKHGRGSIMQRSIQRIHIILVGYRKGLFSHHNRLQSNSNLQDLPMVYYVKPLLLKQKASLKGVWKIKCDKSEAFKGNHHWIFVQAKSWCWKYSTSNYTNSLYATT